MPEKSPGKLVQVWVYSRWYEAGISIPGLPGWTGMEILDVLFQGWYWPFYDVLKENGHSIKDRNLSQNMEIYPKTHKYIQKSENIPKNPEIYPKVRKYTKNLKI